jgi:transcriptional regulator with XRE-family HTH domain
MPKRPATVRARGLGAELRELREAKGLTTREVAKSLGWSASTVSRTENGVRNVSSEDVAALLVLYGVTGRDRDRLLNLARESDQPGWWETRHPGLPSQLTALIGFESQATEIVDVALTLVPGLFIEADGVPTAQAETRVATRLGRQAVLTRPDPPAYSLVLDEASLHRPVGGRQVMAEQLHHMVRTMKRPNITVQVLPFDRGAHAALTGAYVVLRFPKARTIVHLEHKRSSLFLDEPDDVAPFVAGLDTLRHVALDPTRSAEVIAAMAAEYEK